MAQTGKKINELTAITTVSNETVLPAVYVSGGNASSTANKVSIEQISNKITEDISTVLEGKQDKLTAGEGVDITNNVISNTQTSTEWGNITGTLADQTDLSNALAAKQDSLPSGTTGYFLQKTVEGVEWAAVSSGGSAVWGEITGTLSNQTDLQNALDAKQSAGNYLENTATGMNSITLLGSPAASSRSVNIGNNTSTGNGSYCCVAIGDHSQAAENGAIAIGTKGNYSQNTYASVDAVAIGSSARASSSSIAIGPATRSNSSAVAIGNMAIANADYALCLGPHFNSTGATAVGATAIGVNTNATQQYATAVGRNAVATANSAIQLGAGTNSTANTFQVFNTTVVNANGKIPMTSTDVTSLTGYDATKTQVLKNVNGTLTWVDEA